MIMLYNSDQGRYGELISDLEKGADLGRDEYPKTVAAMYELMVKFNRGLARGNNRNNGRRGNAFVQTRSNDGELDDTLPGVPGADGILHPNILCFNCQ